MTDRVIWLIANGYVRPEEYWRDVYPKSCWRLESRVNNAIEQLAAREDIQLDFDTSDIGQATVTTYHSYANSLVAEHGLRIGVEPDARLIGEAESYQYITSVVEDHDSELDLNDVTSEDLQDTIAADVRDRPLSSTIKAVKKLAGDCAEHLVEPDQVRDALADMFTFGQGLPVAKAMSKNTASVFTMLKLRSKIADMVTAYLELKKRENVMDYGDLVRYAATIATQLQKYVLLSDKNIKLFCLTNFKTPRMRNCNYFRSYLDVETAPTAASHSSRTQISHLRFRGLQRTAIFLCRGLRS